MHSLTPLTPKAAKAMKTKDAIRFMAATLRLTGSKINL